MSIADNPDFSNVDRENPASVDADFRKKLQAEQAVGQRIDGGLHAGDGIIQNAIPDRNAIPDMPIDPRYAGYKKHHDKSVLSSDGGPITLEDIIDYDGAVHTEVKRRIGKVVTNSTAKNAIINGPEVLDRDDIQDRMAPLVDPHVPCPPDVILNVNNLAIHANYKMAGNVIAKSRQLGKTLQADEFTNALEQAMCYNQRYAPGVKLFVHDEVKPDTDMDDFYKKVGKAAVLGLGYGATDESVGRLVREKFDIHRHERMKRDRRQGYRGVEIKRFDENAVFSPEKLKHAQVLLEKYRERFPLQWPHVKGTDQ